MGPRAFGGQSNLKFWADHVKNYSAAETRPSPFYQLSPRARNRVRVRNGPNVHAHVHGHATNDLARAVRRTVLSARRVSPVHPVRVRPMNADLRTAIVTAPLTADQTRRSQGREPSLKLLGWRQGRRWQKLKSTKLRKASGR